MTTVDDLGKMVTLGDPDGPEEYREELDRKVPTFIDPRLDLLSTDGRSKPNKKTLNHHVPFSLRGMYKPEQLPDKYLPKVEHAIRTDLENFVLCNGITAAGNKCGTRAANRTLFCVNHGGALHPADKKISVRSIAPMPTDRIQNLDRPQKFMQGFLTVEELTEEEISGGYVLNDKGHKISGRAMGIKFEQMLTLELHKRLNSYLRKKAPSMLKVVTDIAENELAEEADRLKAAIWAAERTIGKVPEVTIHGKTEMPYEQILGGIQSGSREEYRKGVESSRSESPIEGEIQDAELVDISEMDNDESYIETETEVVNLGDYPQNGVDTDLGGHEVFGSDFISEDIGLRRVEEIEEQREKAKNINAERKKIKRRRFAAKATGSTSLNNQHLAIEWIPIKTGKLSGCYRMKLWFPEQLTERILEKIEESNDPVRHAEVLEAKANELEAKLLEMKSKSGENHG